MCNELICYDDYVDENVNLVSTIFNKRLDYYSKVYETFSQLNQSELNQLYKTYKTLILRDFPCVYFIRNKYNGFIKVGSSKNPIRRLGELNNICKVHAGMDDALEICGIIFVPSEKQVTVEKQIHKDLKDKNKFGEWFEVSFDLICNKYFQYSISVNGITFTWSNNDIKNDGFKPLELALDDDMNKIRQSIWDDIIKSLQNSLANGSFKSRILDLGNKLKVKTVYPYVIWDYMFAGDGMPEFIKMYEWLISENISVYTIEFKKSENGYVQCKKYFRNGGKEYDYDSSIVEKIESFFIGLEGGKA